MKKYLLPLFFSLALFAHAQTQLPQPLAFVPADSIVGMGFDRTDLRRTSILGGAGENVPVVSASSLPSKAFKKQVRDWEKLVLRSFSLSGIYFLQSADKSVIAASKALDNAARLLLLTADASFADAIERLAYNQLLATATQPGPASFEKSYALRAIARAAGMAFATDKEGVYINLYSNGSANMNTGGVALSLDVITRMPEEGRVRVRIGGLRKEGTPLKLRVRIPMWAEGKVFPEGCFVSTATDIPEVKIYVNGREPLNTQRRSGYVEIDREWNNGDELMLLLPMPAFLVRPAAEGKKDGKRGQLAAMRGPLVYVPPVQAADCYTVATSQPEVNSEPNAQGHLQLLVKMFRDKNIPADAKAPEANFLLQPIMDCPPAASPWLREPK